MRIMVRPDDDEDRTPEEGEAASSCRTVPAGVDTPDAVARMLHAARAPPRQPPPGQLLLLR